MVRSLVWVGLLALATGGGQLLAQTAKSGEPEVMPPGMDRASSSFALFGDRDLGSTGFRMPAEFTGAAENSGTLTGVPGNSQPWNNFNPSPLFMPDFFDIFFYVAAPPSERDKHAAVAPSLANANNKGYTVNSQLSQYTGEMLPADGTLGPFHSGAQDSGSGDCTDHREVPSGNPLIANSDCEPTWGSLGWQGSRNVDADGWAAYAASVPASEFTFDEWKVPEDLHVNDKFLGTWQAFGYFMDYSTEALFGSATHPAYNDVVPGGVGPATRSGWPMGIYAKIDFFTWPARNLLNVAWYQITVVNNSEDVYGVGLDYDSLYMGFQPGYLQFNQGSSVYRDILNMAVRSATACQGLNSSSSQGTSGNGCGPGGDPQHPTSNWGSAPPEGVGAGFNYGATAIMVLKSPIGDVRNKQLTDPASDFFGLGDPDIWDDTITFNHGHMCGFHGCSAVVWNAPGSVAASADYEQRQFGMVASITSDVVGDRNLADITNHTLWDTWRFEGYPDRNLLDFNRWTPGNWDYDDDGIDDRVAFDDCTDNSTGQFDPFLGITKKCAVTWSDSLPGGFGNVYANRGAVIGVGPIPMASRDTLQWILAVVMANDLAGMENQINEATAHYNRFYLLPEPAPAPNIVSVDVQQGGGNAGADAETAPAAAIALFWDDQTDEWQDPFIASTLAGLTVAPDGSPAGRVRNLNPALMDTLTFLVDNNVEFIYIFKSCDGGGTFTDDGDCESDPATGEGSKFTDAGGWLPYATFTPDDDGNFPNSWVDNNVFGGRSFLYSMNTETRGLLLSIQNGDDAVFDAGSGTWLCTQNCRAETVDIPKLLPIVQSSTSLSYVVDVYIPISKQSGAENSTVTELLASPDFVPFERMNVTTTSAEVGDGDYQLVFGDTVVSVEIANQDASGNWIVASTEVTVTDDGGAPDIFDADGAVALSGDFSNCLAIEVGTVRTTTCTYDADVTSVLVAFDGTPIVVSDIFDGNQTVPGSYFGLSNFPHFTYLVDNDISGGFAGQAYFSLPDTTLIGPLVEPSVTWRDNISSGVTAEGRYGIVWEAPAFGAASPFFLDFTDPVETKASIVESIDARSSNTSSTDADVLTYLGLTVDDVVAVDLPFQILNATDIDNPTPVTVVVESDEKLTELLVGSGLDTMIISSGLDTEWLPGDGLTLVEGTAASGFTTLASNAIIGCDATLWLRTECNPVALSSRGATGYIPNAEGMLLGVQYFQTITSATEYSFNVASAVAGSDLTDNTDNWDAIRASLDSVKVVPNPYVMFSAYATAGGTARVIFTHMPPKGVLRVYTVSGQFVQKINWGPNDLNGNGDLFFNLRTREGNEMSAGLYLFVLTAKDEQGTEIGTAKGKFVLIK